MNRQLRWLTGGIVLVAVIALLALLWRGEGIAVETATVTRGSLSVVVSEQGRTRARLPHELHAPIGGELQRVSVQAGDTVTAGQELARITVAPDAPRNRAAIDANLESSQARTQSARAALRDARSALEQAERDAERRELLFNRDLIGEAELERFQRERDAAATRVEDARAGLDAAEADVAMARALQLGRSDAGQAAVLLRAPVDGTIYRVHERGPRILQAGAPVLTVSHQDRLEVVIDLLTRDAVRVSPGDPVQLRDWGGDEVLEGQVRLVEPEAFTKVSALGVEEQRIDVIVDLRDYPETLGAGYRVEADIIVSQLDDVLSVPASAVFRQNGQWQLFVVEDGVARQRAVETGVRSGQRVEIRAGIEAGATVIRYPSEQLSDGTAVRITEAQAG